MWVQMNRYHSLKRRTIMSVFVLNNFPDDCPFNEIGPFISLYLTTHNHPLESKKDRIEFKKLIAQAKDKLVKDYNKLEIEEFVKPLNNLEQDSLFWSYNQKGLAIFTNKKNCYIYKLPFEVEQYISYSEKINFKPLIRLSQNIIHYYVLALDRDNFNVYEVYGKNINPIQFDPSVKIKAKDVIGDQRTEDISTIGGYSSYGRQGITHGRGGKKDDIDIDTEKYLRYVENTIYEHLSKIKPLPIVLISLHKTYIHYRNLNKNKDLFEKGIMKSPESMTEDEILNETYSLIENYFVDKLKTKISNVFKSVEMSKASNDIHEIVKAIHSKQIQELYIQDGHKLYGYVDWENQTIEVNRKSDLDIYEELAEKTILLGRKVYCVSKDVLNVGSGILAQYY